MLVDGNGHRDLTFGVSSKMSKYTITYKRVGDLDIKIDVTVPPSATVDSSLPALIYYHGGGLLSGCRVEEEAWFPLWIKGALGCIVLCI